MNCCKNHLTKQYPYNRIIQLSNKPIRFRGETEMSYMNNISNIKKQYQYILEIIPVFWIEEILKYHDDRFILTNSTEKFQFYWNIGRGLLDLREAGKLDCKGILEACQMLAEKFKSNDIDNDIDIKEFCNKISKKNSTSKYQELHRYVDKATTNNYKLLNKNFKCAITFAEAFENYPELSKVEPVFTTLTWEEHKDLMSKYLNYHAYREKAEELAESLKTDPHNYNNTVL
jgi:hypothetical protein